MKINPLRRGLLALTAGLVFAPVSLGQSGPAGTERDQAQPADQQPREQDQDEAVDVRERLEQARSLLQKGEYDKALEEYLWLWNNMVDHDRTMAGVRRSFVAQDMKRLASQHPPARDKFGSMRDALEDSLDAGEAEYSHLADWIALNEVLDQTQRTVEWVEAIADRPVAGDVFRRLGFRLFPLLVEHDRWELAGRVHQRPMLQAKQALETASRRFNQPNMNQERKERIRRSMLQRAVEQAATLSAACFAADRDEQGREIAEMTAKKSDEPWVRVVLARQAVAADVASGLHRQWLNEALQTEEIDAEVKAEAQRLLKQIDAASE